MGRVQLKKAEGIKEKRQENFDFLKKELSQFEDLQMVKTVKGADICWFSFPITTKGRRAPLIKFLEENGVETRTMFAGNILRHPAYFGDSYDQSGVKLPGCDEIMKQSFWITCHPRYSPEDLKELVDVFKKYYAEAA